MTYRGQDFTGIVILAILCASIGIAYWSGGIEKFANWYGSWLYRHFPPKDR